MIDTLQYLSTAIIISFLSSITLQAQGTHHCGYAHPDSLTEVTVTGTAIVDTPGVHPMYFLDEDGDGTADYHLNFGPYWYEPDSGDAVRPLEGESITVSGGEQNCQFNNLSVLIVYEINGMYWREPFQPQWNNMGNHMHMGGQHQGGCIHSAFGFMHDPVEPDTLTGTVLVDSTFFYAHYYLDQNGDDTPDYFLNFGPYWYQPESGATRPEDGDLVTVTGGLIDRPMGPMMIVHTIDGMEWRSSQMSGPHFGGQWIHKDMGQQVQVHSPFDDGDWMEFHPGWHHGMGGGHHGGMADSLFCQILEIFPQNMPNTGDMHVFGGYEIGMFDPMGQNGMWGNGGCGNHMQFSSMTDFQMHYNDIQLQAYEIDESTIEVRYWDSHSSTWNTVSDAEVDVDENYVSFSIQELSNFIVLTADESPTAADEADGLEADGFYLKQNYPNPSVQTTDIEFVMTRSARVQLTVYNAMGRKVREPLDEIVPAGEHSIDFSTQSLAPGIYFYQMRVGDKSQIKKMQISK